MILLGLSSSCHPVLVGLGGWVQLLNAVGCCAAYDYVCQSENIAISSSIQVEAEVEFDLITKSY